MRDISTVSRSVVVGIYRPAIRLSRSHAPLTLRKMPPIACTCSLGHTSLERLQMSRFVQCQDCYSYSYYAVNSIVLVL